ncbi:MAG: PIG-L family deacetylase [Patescibacteria group bacterium]|jgi:LmbE family N-acetylglucosaminyl deacetylase
MNLKKIKENLLHLNNLRKFIGYEIFREAMNSETKLQILDTPPSGRVLVLAPHPDDDVIGCGGTIKKHIDNGDSVKVVFLTDGSGGVAKKRHITTVKERKDLTGERESEAKTAALILGVTETAFWRYHDGSLLLNNTSMKLLDTLFSDFKPNIIYAPSFLDPHPDHFETAKILAAFLEKKNNFTGTIFSYEVWSPIYANRLVRLDDVAEFKKQALLAHKSQIESRSYEQAIMGLAKYRAGMHDAGEYAEAFFACNMKLYVQLFNLLSLKK